jgi:hypothetical protein
MAADLAEGPIPRDRRIRHRISLAALLLGVGLLWPFPLAATVLMVAATFGLVISWEEELNVARPPAPTAPFANPIPLDCRTNLVPRNQRGQ